MAVKRLTPFIVLLLLVSIPTQGLSEWITAWACTPSSWQVTSPFSSLLIARWRYLCSYINTVEISVLGYYLPCSFTPLIFSSSGGMGKAATTTYKHLADLLQVVRSGVPHTRWWWAGSDAVWDSPYLAPITCIHGSRSRSKRPGVPPAVDLAVAEGCLTAKWANVDLALSEGRLDAGALERWVSVAGVIQLSST